MRGYKVTITLTRVHSKQQLVYVCAAQDDTLGRTVWEILWLGKYLLHRPHWILRVHTHTRIYVASLKF